MSIELSKEVSNKLSEASDILKLDKEELVNRAVLLYLDNIHKYLELKKEVDVWDEISDEALENFERDL